MSRPNIIQKGCIFFVLKKIDLNSTFRFAALILNIESEIAGTTTALCFDSGKVVHTGNISFQT